MENELVGQLARLLDGQLVKIEIVHSDGFATVRRIEGEWVGEIAVCKLSSLKLEALETILPEEVSHNTSPCPTIGESDDEHQRDQLGQ